MFLENIGGKFALITLEAVGFIWTSMKFMQGSPRPYRDEELQDSYQLCLVHFNRTPCEMNRMLNQRTENNEILVLQLTAKWEEMKAVLQTSLTLRKPTW